ncbi:uncharacterized protein A1O9_12898 [Exophiala aquamarina CBS 119918]|uniref:AB hydrolase-1 domain-containing protein n=1 Tax=Exophiala aquamarina CBS 119918 TaxID=1182545 RepID=A0A072NVH7_9EURO|nr:uncharacterized protein A1O9_12898 [Exophiala aquamarina CBS 119918]KEF51048.1 hypothetical protein A1O9_12898 [Exophiala aquamarina CBS 119918]
MATAPLPPTSTSTSSSSIHRVSPTIQIAYTLYEAEPTNRGPAARATVILINGLADTKETWGSQVPSFTSAGYRVLTYDNRGVGASSRLPLPDSDDSRGAVFYTTREMADDLARLLTHLKIQGPAHLLGVSMGGMIAQSFALEYIVPPAAAVPGIVFLSVTLVCTYAAPGPFCTRMFAMWRDVARAMGVQTVMRDVALWCFSPEFFADETRREQVRDMDAAMECIDDEDAGGMGLGAYCAQLSAIQEFDSRAVVGMLAQRRPGVRVVLPNIVVLAGESDILIPVSLSRELHGLIPGARWCTTRGGHACNWEFPDEFNRTCLDLWTDIETKTQNWEDVT